MICIRKAVGISIATLSLAACADVVAPTAPTEPYVVSTRGMRLFGTARVPVILARFSNGPEPVWSRTDVVQRMFSGADGGLVNQPFHLASSGRFAIDAHVSPWVQTSVLSSGNMNQFALQALAAADPHLNFARFDNDGPDGISNSGDDDGVVDGGVVLLHSSLDQGCFSGAVPPEAGPHPFANNSFTYEFPGTGGPVPFPTADDSRNGGKIGVKAYTVMALQHCSGTATNASVLSHELGHLLFGLPDLYHQVPGVVVPPNERWRGRRWVVGCWELMGAGSWGCGAGNPPKPPEIVPTLGAWSRVWLGWDTPIVASSVQDTVYTLAQLGRGSSVLKIALTSTEYFLVEYRVVQRGDVSIPANGVLIHHVNEAFPRYPATADDPRRYRVSLVEADDDSALVRIEVEGGNRGVGADAFGNAVTEFAPGQHSRARSLAGDAIPFRLSDISFDLARGTASVRVIRDP